MPQGYDGSTNQTATLPVVRGQPWTGETGTRKPTNLSSEVKHTAVLPSALPIDHIQQ